MFLLLTQLLLWLVIGLIAFLISNTVSVGLISPEVQTKSKPNQGIWISFRNAITVSVIVCLILVLICGLLGGLTGWIVASKPLAGVIMGLRQGLIELAVGFPIALMQGGGKACVRHLVLRLIIHHKGHIPYNYAHFLDYATERIFLQKVGGGYIFVHRMLMEHLAQMELEVERKPSKM